MSAAMLVLLGVFATALIAFFAWLATKVIDMRERIVRIEMNIDSLLGTRTSQEHDTTAGTAARLDALEGR